MWSALKRIESKMVRIEEEFVIHSMLALVILQLTQVLFRYVLKNPIAWVDEASSYLLVWTTMIGSGLGVQKLTHFSESFLVEKLPKRLKFLNYIIVTAMNFAFLFLLLYYSFLYIESASGQVSAALRMPVEVLNYSLPVGMILMIYHLVMNIDIYMKLRHDPNRQASQFE